MFILHQLKDTIRVEAVHFGEELERVLSNLIETKFSNKVIPEVGLAICVYDILKIGDCYLFEGDGAAHCEVVFRMVVFSPFVGEVLEGKVNFCTSKRVTLTLGFFCDIELPPDGLPQPSTYNDKEMMWIWNYPTEDGDGVKIKREGSEGEEQDEGEPGFFIHQDMRVRFRVTAINYHADQTRSVASFNEPTSLEENSHLSRQRSQSACTDATASPDVYEAPLVIQVTIREDGLGPVDWWPNEDDDDDDDENEEETIQQQTLVKSERNH